MVTSYPTDTSCRNTQVKAEVELVQKIVSVVRSSRADYNIPNKSKTEIWLELADSATRDTVSGYLGCVSTLAYCSKVNIADSPPQGCAIVTVNDKVRSFKENLKREKQFLLP